MQLPVKIASVAVVAMAAAILPIMAGTPGATASTVADTTPPSLSVDQVAHFAVGSAVTSTFGTWNITDTPFWITDVPLSFQWKGYDGGSGICGYDVDETEVDSTNRVLENTKATSLGVTLNDYDANYGGGSDDTSFEVTAHDCAGNQTKQSSLTMIPVVRQDDGKDPYGEPVWDVAYIGQWKTVSCSCFSGGTTHATSTAGAKVSFALGGPDRVALVMEKAPNRGAAKVYLDGILKTTVNTHSTTTRHHVIVWQAALSAGSHTLTVVNAATKGYPRIDVDAVITFQATG